MDDITNINLDKQIITETDHEGQKCYMVRDNKILIPVNMIIDKLKEVSEKIKWLNLDISDEE